MKKEKQPNKPLKNQKGQGLIEYLILVALVGVAAIAAVKTLSQSVTIKVSEVSKSLGAKVEGRIGRAEVTNSQWKKRDFRNFVSGTLNRGGDSGSEESANEE